MHERATAETGADMEHAGSGRTVTLASVPTLVIFDCDGVLVDSEVVAARVLARELTAIGVPLTADDCIARYTGISLGTVLSRVQEEWRRTPPADFMERVRAADAEAFRAQLRPVAGVREMVQALAAPKCVASSGRAAKMRLTLSLTGLLPFFEPHLFSAEMVARGKPAPDLFLYAAERMSFPPARCVVVEDSQAGVRAAVAAGMRAFGFAGGGHCAPGHEELLRAAGAALVFTRMAELPRLLESMARA
jgi:HAD superfamily hydrolase (TIGR01509 family)